MHIFPLFAAYWWAIVLGMLCIVGLFVLVAGRGAKGGLRGRAAQGWGRWREVSDKAAQLQARIILSIVYFTAALPFGLVRAYLADTLMLRPANQPRKWLERTTRDRTLSDAQRQG